MSDYTVALRRLFKRHRVERTGGHWEGRFWIADHPVKYHDPEPNPNFSPGGRSRMR